MICEDFIMLGRTVPEASKRHGLVVCSAGYSPETRCFMRIYPLLPQDKIPRWSICRLSLERPRFDNRKESWRLKNDSAYEITGKADKAQQFEVLKSMRSKSIKRLNNERSSLAIIEPQNITWRFDQMKHGEEQQLPLFGDEPNIKKKPRLMFTDIDGEHNLQLRDWGAYEFLRKQPVANHHKLWSALQLTRDDYGHILFVGNHNQYRNAWLVISLISNKISAQSTIVF